MVLEGFKTLEPKTPSVLGKDDGQNSRPGPTASGAPPAAFSSAPANLQDDADICDVLLFIAKPGRSHFGFLLLAWWGRGSGPNAYATFEWFIGSLIGRLVLLGYTWGLIHHTLGGIRHLIPDTEARPRPGRA